MKTTPLMLAVCLLALAACKEEEKKTTKPETPSTAPDNKPDEKPDDAPAPPADPITAVAEMKATEGNKVTGTVTFTDKMDGKVTVTVKVEGLSPGDHGFHIHEKGDCSSPDGKSAGGHFNPAKVDHGAPTGDKHHAGDLGNLTADDKGVAVAEMEVDFITLADGQPHTAVGRGVIIHEKADDLKTQPTGAAGSRLACGVIEKK